LEEKEKKAEKRAKLSDRKAEQKEKLAEQKQRKRERERNRELKLKEAQDTEVKKLKERAANYVDPAKPKKNLSPYLLYAQETRAAVKSANPTMSVTQLVSKLAQDWKAISEEQKQPYVERFKIQAEEYKKKLAEFTAANPLPKRPPTPFSAFLRTKYAVVSAKSLQEANAIMKDASKEWKALPENEKKKYQDEYQAKVAQYKATLSSWTDAQVNKLPQSVREFAREALDTNKFKKPREIQVLVADLAKVAAARAEA